MQPSQAPIGQQPSQASAEQPPQNIIAQPLNHVHIVIQNPLQVLYDFHNLYIQEDSRGNRVLNISISAWAYDPVASAYYRHPVYSIQPLNLIPVNPSDLPNGQPSSDQNPGNLPGDQ